MRGPPDSLPPLRGAPHPPAGPGITSWRPAYTLILTLIFVINGFENVSLDLYFINIMYNT